MEIGCANGWRLEWRCGHAADEATRGGLAAEPVEEMTRRVIRPLLIRADASPAIGTGHIMRMIALAQACQDRGGAVTLACVHCPAAIAERARAEGIGFEQIKDCEPGSPTDSEKTSGLAKALGVEWVVLDGYHFHTDFQRALRTASFRVLAVDDYGHCDMWAADAILNQNIFAPELRYRSEVENCRLLLGTRFALLRREFRTDADSLRRGREKSAQTSCSRPIERLLITLGGTDPENVTGRILRALELLGEIRLKIKVLVGSGNLNLPQLRATVRDSQHSVELLQNVSDMPPVYRWADGVVSAGGSTCWEWLFYRLPAAVVCIAENQRAVIEGLVKHGLATDLGSHTDVDPATTALKLGNWLKGAGRPVEVPQALAVDGHGACKVASVLDGSGLWIRFATDEDCRMYFDWANDPEVRANSVHTEPIPWKTHVEWFRQKCHSPTSRLYVASDLEDNPAGQVRLDRMPDGAWEVGLSLARERRARGVGRQMLDLVLTHFRQSSREPISAKVKPQNARSISLFETLGFKRVQDCGDGLLRFTLAP